MNQPISVILVDDHAVVRAGFRMLLATSAAIEVIGEAERGEQVIQLYQELQPDVVVMDLSMPGIGGLETIRRLIQRDSDAAILVFSVHHEQVYVSRALAAGARGYITKNSAPEILIEALHGIMQGDSYVEKGLIKTGPTAERVDYQAVLAEFSAREFDVLVLLAQGLTVAKIAGQLCLGQKTVANYATQIRKKLNINTTAELAHLAIELGIVRR